MLKCRMQKLAGSLWLLGSGSSVAVVGAAGGSPVVEPGLPGGGDGSAWSSSKWCCNNSGWEKDFIHIGHKNP